MSYSEIINRAFSISWRFKYLWLLALLGGADAGSIFFLNAPPSHYGMEFFYGYGIFPHGLYPRHFFGGGNFWLFLVIFLAAIVVVWILLLLLSSLTTGALIRGTAEHDRNQPFYFKLAWQAGVKTFASILSLKLLWILATVILGAIMGVAIALIVISFTTSHYLLGAGLVILTALIALGLLVLLVILGIIFLLTARAIVLEGLTTLNGLRRGFQLFRHKIGSLVLTFLIQLLLSMLVGFGYGIVFTILWIPVALAFGLFVFHYDSPYTLPSLIVSVIPALLFAIAVVVLTGTYFSTYWTIAFLRLTQET